jgi:exosortase/archaeosortase family protein
MTESRVQTAKIAAGLLVLPLVELIFFRFYLHSFLGLRIGFPGMTDYDFFLPGPTGFFLLMHCLHQGKQVTLRFDKKIFLIHICFLFGFLTFNHFLKMQGGFASGFFAIYWTGLFFGMVGSAFCLFVQPSYYLLNPNRWAFLPTLLLVFSFPIYLRLFRFAWQASSFAIYYGIQVFSGLFSLGFSVHHTASHYIVLEHPALKARIGQGCAGLDGMFLFTFTFILLATVNFKKFSGKQWIFVYCLGMVGMYFINLLRILLLFTIGVALVQWLGSRWGIDVFKTIAHAHLGWLLYLFSIATYVGAIHLWWSRHLVRRSFINRNGSRRGFVTEPGNRAHL